jgi:hypothetical protein
VIVGGVSAGDDGFVDDNEALPRIVRAQPRKMGALPLIMGAFLLTMRALPRALSRVCGLPANAVPGGSHFSVCFVREIMPFPIANPTRHSLPVRNAEPPFAHPPDRPCPGTFWVRRGESGLSQEEVKMPAWYGCETHYSSAGVPAPGCAVPTLPGESCCVSVAYICCLR